MITIHVGDCRDVLDILPAESVQTCITSPPYWGLRDYGVEPIIWGGDADCQHEWGDEIPHDKGSGGHNPKQDSNRGSWQEDGTTRGAWCHLCGAWRGCLGLEPTPEQYVSNLVGIFRQVRRVLRDDGTLWLNLGDSYAANKGYQVPDSKWRDVGNSRGMKAKVFGLKPKDLVGIPWRTAFALQADGWWLRSCIVWHKPNCMPESVRDRPTTAHEYVFLLSKSARYYWDQEAVREQSECDGKSGNKNYRAWAEDGRVSAGMNSGTVYSGRNIRTVWTIPTRPFPGAHFATFPPDLVEPMVKAGSAEGDTILDPFAGAGTVGLVADRLGRDAVLVELNQEYAQMAERRIRGDAPMLVQVEVVR